MSFPSSPISPVSPTSPTSSTFSIPEIATTGLLWVSSRITDPIFAIDSLDAWYEEHTRDVLTCPGSAGLFLRYNNLSTDPPPSPSTPEQALSRPWSFLTLVKLPSTSWLSSPEFLSIRHDSAVLPRRPDGSLGWISDVSLAALRGYELIPHQSVYGGLPDGGPKYLVSVQASSVAREVVEQIQDRVAGTEGFRGGIGLRFDGEAVRKFGESGGVPEGLLLFAFEGEQAPKMEMEGGLGKGVERVDVWELRSVAGEAGVKLS